MAQVFISYGREDKAKLDELLALLQLAFKKHNLWYDRELTVGSFPEQILKEINRSKVFVFLVSKDAAQSHYCSQEYEHALTKHKPILPIFIEDPQPCLALMPLKMQNHIRSIQYLVIPEGMITCDVLAELYGHLGKLLVDRPPWRLLAAAFAVLVLVIAGLSFYVATWNNDPEISIQSTNKNAIQGSIKPDFLCSDLFRVVAYVKTDRWYIQPDEKGVSMNPDTCEWEVHPGRDWEKITDIAVHLAPVADRYPLSFSVNTTCPPLTDSLTWHCIKP